MENNEPVLTEVSQDQILKLMITNESFLAQLYRRKVKPGIFDSDVRKKLASMIFEFYLEYETAPGEDILAVIEIAVSEGTIREDRDLIEDYISRIMEIEISSLDFVFDQLDNFLKKQLALTTINSLIKLRERPYISPDKLFEVMSQAVLEATTTIGKQVIELISQDPEFEFRNKAFTRFGIPEMDEQIIMGAGTFAVILAYTNIGKSWCLTHLAKMATMQGVSCLYIPTEMSNITCRFRFKMALSAMGKVDISNDPGSAKEKINNAMIKNSEIMLISEEEKGMAVDELPRIIEEVETKLGKKLNLILLDSAAEMLPPRGQYKTKIEASTATYTYLKNLAATEELCIITTHQATREGHDADWLAANHVSSDINLIRKATLGISLNATEEEIQKNFRRLYVFKNTDGPVGSKYWVRQDLGRGQFRVDSGAYVKKQYTEMVKKS